MARTIWFWSKDSKKNPETIIAYIFFIRNLPKLDISTVENGHKITKKLFGWTQSDNTKITIPMYNFMFFYVFKMAVAIAFLCENAVEAI